jgi:acyl-CoA hydrolase
MTEEWDPGSLDLSTVIRPGDSVIWGQGTAEPLPLTCALMEQRHAIGRFKVFLGMTYSDTVMPGCGDCIEFSSYCGTGRNRQLAKAGKLDILPVHYSQLPELIRSRRLKVDVLILQVAPADSAGNCSLSIAHEYLISALDTARVVIAEINEQAPWTYGERTVRESDFDYILRTSRPPLELHNPSPNEAELATARNVAALIEDGATLQLGIGALPEAVLAQLVDRRDLGVHSGIIGDKVAELTRAGVITNARKNIDRGVTVTGVMMGSRHLYEFARCNPAVQFRSTDYTHDAEVLSSIERLAAINSAIEVDLTGQINAELAGGTYIGGVGGALDFLRGARRSKGGLPIVALTATHGETSRIVPRLHGPVSTPRSDAGIIVTEYGVADLRGLSLSERVRRMIAIAQPCHREWLERESGGVRV